MQTLDHDTTSISLVSWARTARPVRIRALFKADGVTDTILFGGSAIALVLIPLVALIVVLLG